MKLNVCKKLPQSCLAANINADINANTSLIKIQLWNWMSAKSFLDLVWLQIFNFALAILFGWKYKYIYKYTYRYKCKVECVQKYLVWLQFVHLCICNQIIIRVTFSLSMEANLSLHFWSMEYFWSIGDLSVSQRLWVTKMGWTGDILDYNFLSAVFCLLVNIMLRAGFWSKYIQVKMP